MDAATEPDQLMWRAVVAALAGREDAAREMLVELRRARRSSSRPPAASARPG